MKPLPLAVVVCLLVTGGIYSARSQNPPAQNPPTQPAPSIDPYANNAAAGTTTFPLAAPAGSDSNAKAVAPAGR